MAATKTVTYRKDGLINIAIDQDAAGEDLILAADAGQYIVVYGFLGSLDAIGTFSIEDEDDVSVSGVLDIGSIGPFGYRADPGASHLYELALGKDLQIQSGTGKFSGTIVADFKVK